MITAIACEAALQKSYLSESVSTVYFGGGTPSLLSEPQLAMLLDTIRSLFDIVPTAEITLEANPDDITTEKLVFWQTLGINRLSIGVQSFFDEDLQWMNRAHNAGQAVQCIELAQQAGIRNLTIDLIYGTPGLTDLRWEQNIKTALSLFVPHLSCYALTVEPQTALDTMIRKGRKENVDPAAQSTHFDILMAELTMAGYEHYEISNFAIPGFRSKHNSSYWQGKCYLGLGPSAHSFNGTSRQWNVSNNALYLKSIQQGIVPFELEKLTNEQQLNEYLMISLRTLEGCSLQKIEMVWGHETVSNILHASQKHLDAGSLMHNNNHLYLTHKGKFLADGIAADLFQLTNR